ncbi:uncharacterized mitochondrial protein AtMg00860-like [Lycium ferocissimum]|uniref:uncharacterized mitochondrial protein AtMg00860-like n=1 Tax=Lycium ferocissimum TaxID=112874 RepID=UPI0028158E4D|nr:uncharacterized mitochondrial protein AtMg00860-like [Lycium ferocissimum]
MSPKVREGDLRLDVVGPIANRFRVKKLVNTGCLAYLTHVHDTTVASPSLKSIPIMNEFAEKIEAVRGWARPATITEIHSFVGLASYYHRFVKGFAAIASSFTGLTQKNVRLQWSDDYEESFQNLKLLLTLAPVLALPVKGKDFTVYGDASSVGLGLCVDAGG